MKFSSAVLALFAATAAASPSLVEREPTLVERDLATITSVLSGIQSQVVALDGAIKAYTSGTNGIADLESDSQKLVSTINSGVTTVDASSSLDTNDALQLVQPVQSLASSVSATINDLISKKSALVAAGVGSVVEGDLQMQLTAANNLAKAITSKVPQGLQSTASSLASSITAPIQKGVTAFQGTGGSSSGSSSSSSSGSSSSSSASSSGSSSASSSSSSASSSSASSSASTTPTSSASTTGSSSSTSGGSSPSTTGVTPITTNAAALNGVSAPVALAALAAVLAF